jgi:hypothetical protein
METLLQFCSKRRSIFTLVSFQLENNWQPVKLVEEEKCVRGRDEGVVL